MQVHMKMKIMTRVVIVLASSNCALPPKAVTLNSRLLQAFQLVDV
jgi:hypothetical protein